DPTRPPRSSRSRARRSSKPSASCCSKWSAPTRCPISRNISTRSAGTSHRSAPTGRPRSRPPTSTCARSRSTAALTKSKRTSSPRRYWGCDKPERCHFGGRRRREPGIHAHRPSIACTTGVHGFRTASLRSTSGMTAEGVRRTMDFEFSEEQRLLKESVEGLLSDRYDFEQRKAYMQEPGGFGRALWKQYADLGLLGLPFDEAHGGSGGGPVETMIVAEAFGRALALEPYLATVVLAGGLLRHAGSQTQRDAILPKVAEGSMLLAFAHAERQARYDLADVATSAKR